MTDKQIIDKVNVKECKYYCNGKCERYEEFVEADYANYSVKCICEKENDLGTYDICDYQQLKRKEQECEELKKQYNCYACDTCKGKEDYINLKRHCENAIKSLHNKQAEFDQLKAENEELKKYKDVVNKLAGMQVILTNEEKMPMLYENAKDLKLKQLSKTLTEIKELLLKTPTDNKEHCVNAKSVILQKISEVSK